MTRVAALIPAAGGGTRLGLGPKAFVKVGGRTLLELAVESLAGHVSEVVVAVPAEALARARELLPTAVVVAGGTDRQATVRALLAASDAPTVLVHDAARPFLTPDVAARLLAAVVSTGAATVALAPADTVVWAEDGQVLERERLRLVQTPQGFARELLVEAHARAVADGFSATDDAALVSRLGTQVTLVEGSPLLTKLTVPADLPLFEALHAAWARAVRGAGRS